MEVLGDLLKHCFCEQTEVRVMWRPWNAFHRSVLEEHIWLAAPGAVGFLHQALFVQALLIGLVSLFLELCCSLILFLSNSPSLCLSFHRWDTWITVWSLMQLALGMVWEHRWLCGIGSSPPAAELGTTLHSKWGKGTPWQKMVLSW